MGYSRKTALRPAGPATLFIDIKIYNRVPDGFFIIASDNFHPDYYKIKETRCDDGRALTAQEFNAAFGAIPGTAENFPEKIIFSRDDIHRIFSFNKDVLAAAQQGGCPMTPPPEEMPAPVVS